MTDSDTDEHGTLSADDAFGALGNETRMEILRALGDADDPLTFSQLREAVGMRDSGQFNYHLDKLLGRFVEQDEAGYRLRQTGRRVREAILSGVVTRAPRSDLTVIDERCHYCGSPIAVLYAEERVHLYCTNCEGTYSGTHSTVTSDVPAAYGRLGTMLLPPAGVEGRSPAATYRVAWTWANVEILAAASGVCPRCSADVEHSAEFCSEHGPVQRPANGRRRRRRVQPASRRRSERHRGRVLILTDTRTWTVVRATETTEDRSAVGKRVSSVET